MTLLPQINLAKSSHFSTFMEGGGWTPYSMEERQRKSILKSSHFSTFAITWGRGMNPTLHGRMLRKVDKFEETNLTNICFGTYKVHSA
jgi:hypothetical protein